MKINIKIEYGKDCLVIMNWCEDNIGKRGENWSVLLTNDIFDAIPAYIPPHDFYFKNENDATLFQLTWG